MHKKYPVVLSDIERAELACLIAAGTDSTRKLLHAQVLFNADQSEAGSAWVAGSITEAVEDRLEAARNRQPPRRTFHRKLDGIPYVRLITPALHHRRHPDHAEAALPRSSGATAH